MPKKLIIILSAFSILTVVTLIFSIQHKSPETVYASDNLIRLHVVANSDSAADQDLKRKVRDEIILYTEPEFIKAENMDSARSIARANLDGIKEVATREIKAQGRTYPVQVELDSFPFPTKHYGPFILPAGDYEAVKVTIGAGGGTNWWCVLFPPLCFVDMSKAAESSRTEYSTGGDILPLQSGKESDHKAPDTEVPKITSAGTEATGSVQVEEEVATVEFRFKIIDLVRSFFA